MEIAVFISKVEELQCQIKQQGEEISDSLVISKILNSLPSKYSHFHSAWDSTYKKEQTLDNLTRRLLLEERRMKATNSEEESVALAVKRETKFSGNCFKCGKSGHSVKYCRSGENIMDQPKCYYCNKTGHFRKYCRFKDRKEHADLSAKLDDSVGGSRYFLLIKDDFSHYRTVNFLQEKSDTFHKLKHFIKFYKMFTENSVKPLGLTMRLNL